MQTLMPIFGVNNCISDHGDYQDRDALRKSNSRFRSGGWGGYELSALPSIHLVARWTRGSTNSAMTMDKAMEHRIARVICTDGVMIARTFG
jgi:hypothetical protein